MFGIGNEKHEELTHINYNTEHLSGSCKPCCLFPNPVMLHSLSYVTFSNHTVSLLLCEESSYY